MKTTFVLIFVFGMLDPVRERPVAITQEFSSKETCEAAAAALIQAIKADNVWLQDGIMLPFHVCVEK